MSEQIKGIPVDKVLLKSDNIDAFFKEQIKGAMFNSFSFIGDKVLSYDGKVALSLNVSSFKRDVKEVNI